MLHGIITGLNIFFFFGCSYCYYLTKNKWHLVAAFANGLAAAVAMT